jgi:hypothetical protein
MDKITGDSIDLLSIHAITQKHIELLNSYTNLLSEVESLDNNMRAMKLVEDSQENLDKLSITNQLTKTVSNMVVDFVQITSYLHELEKKFSAE